jgi:hypothetical protein
MPLASDCISRAGLRDLALAALQAAGTLAGLAVYTAKTFPTDPVELPMLILQTPIERKESLGRNGPPSFTTVMHLAVNARVTGTSEAAIETDLDTLCSQVEAALLCSDDFMRVLQQVRSVDTQFGVFANGGALIGAAEIVLECETFQEFDPPPGEDVQQFSILADINDDGVPDLAFGVNVDAPLQTEDGADIAPEGGELGIELDGPPLPINPWTGEPAGT